MLRSLVGCCDYAFRACVVPAAAANRTIEQRFAKKGEELLSATP